MLLEHPFLMWVMFALALETMFVTAWFVKKMAWASLRRRDPVRPSEELGPLVERMRGAAVDAVVVTTSDGRLLGLLERDRGEQAMQEAD